MKLFETMRLEEGQISRESYHYKRLKQSSEALGFKFDDMEWKHCIQNIQSALTRGTHRIKVLLSKEGTLQYVDAPLPKTQTMTASLKKLDSSTPTWQRIYKTTKRDYLNHSHVTQLVLLYDINEKILEFDIGNVVVEFKGQYITPKYEGDFLRGCMRQALLDGQKIEVGRLTLSSLKQFLNQGGKLWMINSLRGWVPVKLIEL